MTSTLSRLILFAFAFTILLTNCKEKQVDPEVKKVKVNSANITAIELSDDIECIQPPNKNCAYTSVNDVDQYSICMEMLNPSTEDIIITDVQLAIPATGDTRLNICERSETPPRTLKAGQMIEVDKPYCMSSDYKFKEGEEIGISITYKRRDETAQDTLILLPVCLSL